MDGRQAELIDQLQRLSERLDGLERRWRDRPQLSLEVTPRRARLGEPLLLTVRVTEALSGRPVVGLAVQLIGWWGELVIVEGSAPQRGVSVRGVTGLDGSMTASLMAPTQAGLTLESQAALAAMLAELPLSGERPVEALAELRQLVERYRLGAHRAFSQAVDELLVASGWLARLERLTVLPADWSVVTVPVVAVLADGSTAALAGEVIDWLPAFLVTYRDWLPVAAPLAAELGHVGQASGDAGQLLSGVYTRVRRYLDASGGLVGERLAPVVAAEAVGRLALAGPTGAPLAAPAQALPGLATAISGLSLVEAGSGELGRLGYELTSDQTTRTERLEAATQELSARQVALTQQAALLVQQVGEVEGRLSSSIDRALLDQLLVGKADRSALDQLAARSIDRVTFEAALKETVRRSELDERLGEKIDSVRFDEALKSRASLSDVERAVSGLVDQTMVLQLLDRQLPERVGKIVAETVPNRIESQLNDSLVRFRRELDVSLTTEFRRLRVELQR